MSLVRTHVEKSIAKAQPTKAFYVRSTVDVFALHFFAALKLLFRIAGVRRNIADEYSTAVLDDTYVFAFVCAAAGRAVLVFYCCVNEDIFENKERCNKSNCRKFTSSDYLRLN